MKKVLAMFALSASFSMIVWALVATIVFLATHPITNDGAYPALVVWFVLLITGWFFTSNEILKLVKSL